MDTRILRIGYPARSAETPRLDVRSCLQTRTRGREATRKAKPQGVGRCAPRERLRGKTSEEGAEEGEENKAKPARA